MQLRNTDFKIKRTENWSITRIIIQIILEVAAAQDRMHVSGVQAKTQRREVVIPFQEIAMLQCAHRLYNSSWSKFTHWVRLWIMDKFIQVNLLNKYPFKRQTNIIYYYHTVELHKENDHG